jgi:UDP-glucose:(heptosyl)LPS alpha-1,3-glucosyltransferase
MKIALVYDRYRPSAGGAGRCVDMLARAWLEAGCRVTLLTADAEEAPPEVEVRRLSLPFWPRGERVRRFVEESSRRLEQESFDLSIGFGYQGPVNLFFPHGGSWKAWARQECVSFEGPPLQAWRKLALKCSGRQRAISASVEATLKHPRLKGIVSISEMVARDLRRDYGVDRVPTEVCYNGVLAPKILPRSCLPDGQASLSRTPTLLFAAKNPRLKGLIPFLRLVAHLDRNGVACRGVVVGPTRLMRCSRWAHRLGCAHLVEMSGPVSDMDMEACYAKADLLVQPTFYDPCSLTTLEALAHGVPVVTTRFNGAGELIERGRTGWVVEDPRDIEGMAAGVAALSASSTIGQARREARSSMADRTVERHVREVTAFCERILSGV